MSASNQSTNTFPTYQERNDNFIPSKQDFYAHPDKYAVEPFRIFGNLYYVGDQMVCSHLVDTGEGLILFDTGYGQTTHMLLNSIRTLGFDPMDIRYIIHSHGHFDHFGSGDDLRAMTGAKVCMSAVDTALLRERPDRAMMQWGPRPNDPICWPDIEIQDGDHIRLGNTDISCVLSPGHTLGTLSFFFDVTEGDRTLRAGYFGGTGLISIYKDHCRKYGLPLDKCQRICQTMRKLQTYSVDITLGNHPSQNGTLEKRQQMIDHPGENPFLDSNAWSAFLHGWEKVCLDFEAAGY